MDKLKMHSADKVKEHITQIAALFPNTLTETIKDGKVEQAIDFDILKQELSDTVVDGPAERYQFTWPDKKKSILLANAPIAKTLRPCREESVDFDTTQNLYIEGDNLDALKLLQETYLGKVKMIYIDPPYNTGNDFVYEDDFAQRSEEYLPGSGQYDEEGGRLVTNMESNGRFHTDWLNMMYPRLKLAKDLLSEDGVIFISIDDIEVANLRKLCDEIFGTQNFITQIVWQRAYSPISLKHHFSQNHDHLLVFCKNIQELESFSLTRTEAANSRYKNPDNDPRGAWKTGDLSVGPAMESNIYQIKTPSGRVVLPPNGRSWVYSQQKFEELIKDNRIWFGENGSNVPSVKRFISEVKDGLTPMTIWTYQEVGHNQDARKETKELFDGKAVFDYPKPVKFIQRMLDITTKTEDSLILDFFSGSATTAHAIFQQSIDDGKKRKFIMVQLPEETDKLSEAYKSGYKNICEIGKERIRRAGKKIKSEAGAAAKVLDTGFRVLKIDSTNMRDVYYNPAEYQKDFLGSLADNIKPDRTAEDLLFQVMLDLGILLSSPINETLVGGKKVFDVADGYLLACFDQDVSSDLVTEIAKRKPYYAVFRDSSMSDDSVATNFDQIFATYSPTTVRKVL